jgi:L-aminopeptidase/D-esterase-like protein
LKDAITDVPGIEVGHAQDLQAGTGCTVILCRNGATPGVSVSGGAPATRETDCLRPENVVTEAHAVVLTGGSAYGLDCAGGVISRSRGSVTMSVRPECPLYRPPPSTI